MEELYRQLILSWRESFENLTSEERTSLSNLDDFRVPCQLEVILLENQQLGITEQLWIISHFDNEPDLSITIHGPINSIDANNRLPEISKLKRFERLLPENTMFLGVKMYRDLIEGHLLRLIESFRNSALRKLWSGQQPIEGVRSKYWLSEEAFVWEFGGVLDLKAIDRIVGAVMKDAKDNARQKKQAPIETAAPKRNEIKARGTYIYPHVWVGSRPSHPFENDLNDRMYARQHYESRLQETVVFDKVGDFYGLTTREGLVAVTMENNTAALRILNSFMSLLTIQGIPALAARDNELGELTLDPNSGKVLGSHMTVVLPRMLPSDFSFVRPRWQEERMPVLEVNFVKQIWKNIARILQDEVSLDLLQIFGEVYTHFQRGEYPQTTLLAWTLIERWYVSTREQAVEPEKLKKTRRISHVADIVHLLEAETLIDRDMASKIYRLWQLRTEVVHTFKNVTKEEAQIALATIATILEDFFTKDFLKIASH